MDLPPIATFIVAITGLITAAAAFHKNRSDVKVAKTTTFDGRYEVLFDQVQDHLLEPMQQQLTLVRVQLEQLNSQFEGLELRYRQAIEYIRLIRYKFNKGEPLPEPPEDIIDDL